MCLEGDLKPLIEKTPTGLTKEGSKSFLEKLHIELSAPINKG